jgi:hypothetical protein
MIPLRLVIDTNVVVSAALKPEGLQQFGESDLPAFTPTKVFQAPRRGFAQSVT